MLISNNTSLNFQPKKTAYSFQAEASDFCLAHEYSGIFYEQGLGKTKIALDILLKWLADGTVTKVLVVTKKGLLKNWEEEVGVHSFLTPRILTTDRGANHTHLNGPAKVLLAGYETVTIEQKRLTHWCRFHRVAIILDESQKIKNPDSKLTRSFLELSAEFARRVIMTGTPIANRPYDIWSQIYFLDSGESLGTSFENFKDGLELPRDGNSGKLKAQLESIFPSISSFCIRQTKQNSGLELPNKSFEDIKCEWEPLQEEKYQTLRSQLELVIQKDGDYLHDNAEDILKRLLRLTQIASNPKLVDDSYNQKPGKLVSLDKLVHKIIGGNEKAIIWTAFVDNCNFLLKHFLDQGISAVKINGKMPINQRNNSVEEFKKDDRTKILVATPQSAKEGLTLTVANHVIFYDRTFSLDDYTQSQDRIHRISQINPCFVYNLIMRDSIDEWTSALIRLKSSAATVALGDDSFSSHEDTFSISLNDILEDILNA